MSPSPSPTNKVADEMQPKEVTADLSLEEVQPSNVRLEDEEPDKEWRSVFNYQSRTLRESDSLYRSPSVVASLKYVMVKAENMAEHAKTPSLQLRNEALEDFLKVYSQAYWISFIFIIGSDFTSFLL